MLKKITSILLIITLLLLSSCNSSKKSSEYPITLYSSECIFDETFIITATASSNNVIYVTNGTDLLQYNISTGETSYIDIQYDEITSITTYGNSLFILCQAHNIIYELSCKTYELLGTYDFTNTEIDISQFCVSDNYVLLYGAKQHEYKFFIIDKETKTLETVETTFDVGAISFYNEDKVMLHINTRSSIDSYFVVYDIVNDSFGTKMFSQVVSVQKAAYSPYTDEIYFSAYDVLNQTINLKSLDMDTCNIRTLKMSYVSNGESSSMRFIETIGNIIIISRSDSEIEFIDVDDLENTITIGTFGYMPESMQYLMTQYNLNYGGTVNEVNFSDKEKMQLKLMAGDDDIDLYLLPSYMNIADFVRNHAYQDLSEYSLLQNYLDLPIIKATVNTGDEIFGIPVNTSFVNSELLMIDDELYLYMNNLRQYIYENIDLKNKVYHDQDGAHLLDILNHMKVSDISSDIYAKPHNGHYTYIISDYIILNPASEKKEQSLEFIKYIVQELSSGENSEVTENNITQMTYYPTLDDYSNTYIDWIHYDVNIYVEINDFAHSYLQNGDASGLSALCNKIKLIVME